MSVRFSTVFQWKPCKRASVTFDPPLVQCSFAVRASVRCNRRFLVQQCKCNRTKHTQLNRDWISFFEASRRPPSSSDDARLPIWDSPTAAYSTVRAQHSLLSMHIFPPPRLDGVFQHFFAWVWLLYSPHPTYVAEGLSCLPDDFSPFLHGTVFRPWAPPHEGRISSNSVAKFELFFAPRSPNFAMCSCFDIFHRWQTSVIRRWVWSKNRHTFFKISPPSDRCIFLSR